MVDERSWLFTGARGKVVVHGYKRHKRGRVSIKFPHHESLNLVVLH
jgi:hypothetical protein